MKILCFVDLHGDKSLLKKLIKRAKKDDIDLVVMAGDLTVFETGLRYFLRKLNDIKKKDLEVTFKVIDYKDSKAITEIIKYEILPSSLKRKVRDQETELMNHFFFGQRIKGL